MTVDFAALPPEVNSGRMYAGAGAGPMVAAASAWDGLASELGSAAASYQSVVSELTGELWQGLAAGSMVAAAAPYAAWMHTIAMQAEQTAGQARAAAAAYEAAFAATVPPSVIAANRALLAALVATNVLGQNTPAIAANQAQYAEMWAQDAAAMYGYAGASAAATTLVPFAEPSNNTNPAGTGNQAAAVAQAAGVGGATHAASVVPNALQGLASGSPSEWLMGALSSGPVQNFEALGSLGGLPPAYMFDLSGMGFTADPGIIAGIGHGIAMLQAPAAALSGDTLGSGSGSGSGSTLVRSLGSGSAGLADTGVSAGLGRAGSLGGLSVPPSWGEAAPEIQLAAKSLPMAGPGGAPAVAAAGSGGWFGGGGVPMVGSLVNAPRSGDTRSRYGARSKGAAKEAAHSDAHADTPPNWWVQRGRRTSVGHEPLTERERNELNALREATAAIAQERDALKHSAALSIMEAMQR